MKIKDFRSREVSIILSFIILLFLSFFIVDWLIYFLSLENVYYAGIAKPTLTFLCFIFVIYSKKVALDNKDWWLLLFAFLCMVPTDILMSIFGLNPNVAADSLLFMVGGILSIIAHFILAIRHGKGFPYWKKSFIAEQKQTKSTISLIFSIIWIGLVVFGVGILVMILLWSDIVNIGHGVIAPIYLAFFCMSTWISWEAVRHKLYPKKNALLIAFAMSAWFLTEVFGEISNINIGNPSEISFRIVWIFYSTTIIGLAFSGRRYSNKNVPIETELSSD